ncbi:DUF1737 domain-containing protein [Luteolibacter marinus]|uniref:DUF1737 domain-containing protein n=1 Tax=Luteolibacter marinus TaxID=2776705 RepID=UPI0018685809|nr:DUF1737 domain-containing protein [Luteolibacter marinus]
MVNDTQYTVVTSDDFGKFEDRVNQLLGKGWRLQGGVATAALPDSGERMLHVQWSQAMILPSSSAVLEVLSGEAEEPISGFEPKSRPEEDDRMSSVGP